MTTRQRLFLTSWEKFVHYGVVPWKLILNVALLVLFTSHVIIMNVQESNYIMAASRSWYYWFYPAGYDFSDVVWYTYTVEDTVAAVQRAVGSYYSLASGGSSIGTAPDAYNYTWVPNPSGSGMVPAPPTLTVESYTDLSGLFTPGASFEATTATTVYTFNNATDLGPLNLPPPALAAFFRAMVTARLDLPPISNFAFGSLYRNCMSWALAVNYDFTNRGQIQLTMDQSVVGSCDVYVDAPAATSWAVYGHKLLWLNFIIFGLAVVHIVLIIKATLRSWRLMNRLRKWAATQAAEMDAALNNGRGAEGYHPPGSTGSEEEGSASSSSSTGPRRRKVGGSAAAPPTESTGSVGPARGVKLSLCAAFDAEGDGSVFLAADGAAAGSSGSARSGLASAGATTPGSAGGSFYISASHVVEAAGAAGTKASSGNAALAAAGSSAAELREPLLGGGAPDAASASGVAASSSSSSALPAGEKGHHLGEGVLLLHAEGDAAKAAAAGTGQQHHYRESIAAAAELLHTKWESLPWRERFGFINGWSIVALLADVLVIASCVWNLHIRTGVLPFDNTHSFIMAAATASLWVSVLRYFEHNRTYFNIVLTLRRAGPRVLRFLVGILPIFIAYALFAVVMFSDRIPRFCDLRTAFITLFANLNGDVVRETFMAIMAYHPVVGQFYFYTFISLHIYVVLNIIIAVVEESYFITITKTEEMEERQHNEGSAAAPLPPAPAAAGGAAAAQPQQLHGQPSTQSSLASGGSGGGGHGHSHGPAPPASAAAAAGVLSSVVHRAAPLPRVLAALPEEIDPLHTPARLDSHGVKERPESKLTAMLRLAEWAEVVEAPGSGQQQPKQ